MSKKTQGASKKLKEIETQLPMQIRALYWPKEKLKETREKRLRKLLAYAKKNSPWYKETLAHINPEKFTEEMLNEIPIINKSILMENWNNIVTNPLLSIPLVEEHIEKMKTDNQLLFLLNNYRLLVTSGSSGRRGIFIYDKSEWNTYYLMFKRYRFYNSDRSGMILNPMKKISIGAIIGTNAIHSIYSLEMSYKTRNTDKIYFPLTAPMEEIVHGLNEKNPDVLLGSSSTIYRLSKEAIKQRLKISPKVISLYGEPFYPPIRTAIEETWKHAAIFNTFGTSEGLCANYCKANSREMHLNSDLCITKLVDSRGNPVKNGSSSNKIYITNLFNYTLPLIRYEIPDEISILEINCSCGSRHQVISEPKNRAEFDFTYDKNIFVNHIIFAYPLLSEKNINEYQVIQTINGADISIVTAGSVNTLKLKATIRESLRLLKETIVDNV